MPPDDISRPDLQGQLLAVMSCMVQIYAVINRLETIAGAVGDSELRTRMTELEKRMELALNAIQRDLKK